MPKVELIAKRAGRYPMKVKVGDRFSVSRADARLLVAVGYAAAAPPLLPPKPEPKPALLAPTPPKRREYLRRDLTPED